MNLGYLSGTAIPSRAASALHAVRMSEALADLGHDVCLWAIANPGESAGIDEFYGVVHHFRANLFPPVRTKRGGGYYFALRTFLDLLGADRPEAFYGRHPHALFAVSHLDRPLAYEAHALPSSRHALALEKRIFSRPLFRRLVCITQALAGDYRRLLGEGCPEITVLADAADPAGPDAQPVSPWPGRDGALQIGYVGHLYDGKGMEIVAQLPARMPDCDFHVVGGREEEIGKWRGRACQPNLHFHGFQPFARLGDYYAHFDIVLLPLQSSVSIADSAADIGRWTSPLKAFEYMAHGKAIVASDVPVLKEIFTADKNAVLVSPVAADEWRDAIRRLEGDLPLRSRLESAALGDFTARYTWLIRAEAVVDILS